MKFEQFYQTFAKHYEEQLLSESALSKVPRKLLNTSHGILSLPEKRGYGYWVDRSGNYVEVEPYGHEEAAYTITKIGEKYLKGEGIKYVPNHPYKDLWADGWARIVYNYNGTIVYYALGGEKHVKKLTTPQAKFIKDLQIMYDIPESRET